MGEDTGGRYLPILCLLYQDVLLSNMGLAVIPTIIIL